MSSFIGSSDSSQPIKSRLSSINDSNESDSHSDQYSRRSQGKQPKSHQYKTQDDDQSRQKRSSTVSAIVVPNITIQPHGNQQKLQNTNRISVMIIGSHKYTDILDFGPKRKLFKKFPYDFNDTQTASYLVNDILKVKRFIKNRSPPAICVLYGFMSIKAKEPLPKQYFKTYSTVYILLIPVNTSTSDKISEQEPLKFYDPPDLSHSLDAYIRISEHKAINKTLGICRIPNFNENTKILELQACAEEFLKDDKDYRSKLYYYGYELLDNKRPLAPNYPITIHRDKMPVILDLVLTEMQVLDQNSSSSFPSKCLKIIAHNSDEQLRSMPMEVIIKLGDEFQFGNTADVTEIAHENSKHERFYGNWAFMYYVRLCMYIAITNQSTLPKSTMNQVLLDFFTFCDKDKSSKLDEREWSMGLLTIFKYINESLVQNKLSVNSCVPFVYHYEQGKPIEYCNQEDFQTLIVDTLTEHIRMQAIKSKIYFNQEESVNIDKEIDYLSYGIKIDKEIDNLSYGIKKTLTTHLKIAGGNDNHSPFSVFETFVCILLIPLSIIFPFIFIIFTFIIRSKEGSLVFHKRLLRSIIAIICCIILSSIVYLTLINLIFYHVYYNDNSKWDINSLEVYWPFALVVYVIIMCYLYLFNEFYTNKNYIKRKEFEEIYHNTEIDILKQKVEITTSDGQRMTLAQYDLKNHDASTYSNENRKSNKLKYFFHDIYDTEFRDKKIRWIIFKIFVLIFTIALAIAHTCVPTIYRNHFTNKSEPIEAKPFQIELIKISYFVLGLPLYLIFLLMIIYAFHQYKMLYSNINEILRKATNDNQYSLSKKKYYLNLKKPDNLDLFLALLRREFRKKDHIRCRIAFATIKCALIFDLILSATSFIRLIYYGFGTLNTLTTVYALIDIIILSILVILFLFGISSINTTATINVLELLLRTKKEVVSERSRGLDTDQKWNIVYLSATSDYIKTNRNMYVITLFGQTIDSESILRLIITLLAGIASAAFSIIEKRLEV